MESVIRSVPNCQIIKSKVSRAKISPVSKSIISSIVAAVFDPLGLINQIIVVYKIFLQQLWLHKLDWTGQLTSENLEQWMSVYTHLLHMKEITVNWWK